LQKINFSKNPELCGLSVEYLGWVQRNARLKMEKIIGIWITNFGLLI
jgi:hypothetical protein